MEQFKKIIGYGVEKVAISSTFLNEPSVVTDAANFVGSQSVVVVWDGKNNGRGGSYKVWTHNATRRSGLGPVPLAKRAEDLGAGEIVINSVDRDGTMTGYDMELIGQVREAIGLPLTVLGGAGSLEDFSSLHLRDHRSRCGELFRLQKQGSGRADQLSGTDCEGRAYRG